LKVDRNLVESIANLAQLRIDEADIQEYIDSMTQVLDLVEQMRAVDTRSIEAMAHPLETTQRLRSDEVTEEDQRDKFQVIAPATEHGLYLVPKVIE
jgi:aspartyl-tRNA(Asn)/glutamyl-tRNA(Gln) amidotransferase subunit C